MTLGELINVIGDIATDLEVGYYSDLATLRMVFVNVLNGNFLDIDLFHYFIFLYLICYRLIDFGLEILAETSVRVSPLLDFMVFIYQVFTFLMSLYITWYFLKFGLGAVISLF